MCSIDPISIHIFLHFPGLSLSSVAALFWSSLLAFYYEATSRNVFTSVLTPNGVPSRGMPLPLMYY